MFFEHHIYFCNLEDVMKNIQKWALLTMVCFMQLAASLYACTGDESKSLSAILVLLIFDGFCLGLLFHCAGHSLIN
jgi:hypothetical protein